MVKSFHSISTKWVKHFKSNSRRQMSIPWSDQYQLTEQERKIVIPSIQQFELGENSSGKTFIKKASAYSKTYDPDYIAAVRLFIKEEQGHSAYLRKFLLRSFSDRPEVSTIDKYWLDTLFRKFRKMLDLEVEVMVLLTAENIAMVYYKALSNASKSPILKKICKQILRDEVKHIDFQASSLANIRRTLSPVRRNLSPYLNRIFLVGTILVVWKEHGSLFITGGYSFGRFWKENFCIFNEWQHKAHPTWES